MDTLEIVIENDKMRRQAMAKEKKLVESITSMEEDFAQWYTDTCVKADLIAYTSVKGCMVLKPAGYAIWELIQKQLDERFKATGVENVYLPILCLLMADQDLARVCLLSCLPSF